MLAYIALGGVLGTVARYGLQGFLQERAGTILPLGTVVVNVIGSFALGFVLKFATGSTLLSPEWRAGIAVGFCGAFTTMSTFSYETLALLYDGEYWRAGIYAGGTLAGCFGAVWLGMRLAGLLL
ncbi:Putative fluoride ion transporter CrcB [bacterium HR33]|nr:Putative fluoride ion transporter CrcB [bacterium HR33]